MDDVQNVLAPPVGPNDHSQGPEDAPVTLVEYGDYECPYCGRAYSIIKEVQERIGDRLRFVFRNFPISTSHQHAQRAAEAAEAAALQGTFWEMHDALYENQHDLTDRALVGYAQDLGLDVDQFVNDLNSGKPEERVRKDFRSGLRSGVNGTPTFFLNGQRYDDSWDPDTLTETIQSLLR